MWYWMCWRWWIDIRLPITWNMFEIMWYLSFWRWPSRCNETRHMEYKIYMLHDTRNMKYVVKAIRNECRKRSIHSKFVAPSCITTKQWNRLTIHSFININRTNRKWPVQITPKQQLQIKTNLGGSKLLNRDLSSWKSCTCICCIYERACHHHHLKQITVIGDRWDKHDAVQPFHKACHLPPTYNTCWQTIRQSPYDNYRRYALARASRMKITPCRVHRNWNKEAEVWQRNVLIWCSVVPELRDWMISWIKYYFVVTTSHYYIIVSHDSINTKILSIMQ